MLYFISDCDIFSSCISVANTREIKWNRLLFKPVDPKPAMRTLLHILSMIIFTILPVKGIMAQCPPGDISFQTQQQIDEFAKNYPHCSEISGNVQIGVSHDLSDIRDLTPLQHIRSINGYLNLINNPVLTDLQGLQKLISIGGYLNIFKNDQLKNVDGLANLESVGGFLWIIRNSSLNSLISLRNLTTINGSLDVSFNSSLSSLNGLENIDPKTISTTPTYLLTPIIDVHILENGPNSEVNLPNITGYRQRHSPLNRFRKMAHKPYSERAVETDFIYKFMDHLNDPIKADSILKNLSDIALSSDDNQLVWESEFLKSYYLMMHGSKPFPERIARMKALADSAGHEGVFYIQARALKFIAIRYRKDLRDYQKLFKTYDALQQVLELMSPDEFPDRAQCYMLMGLGHYLFRDYRQAIRYFREGASIPKTPLNTTFVTHCINNLGLSYRELNIPDSSDYYFNLILRDTTHYPVGVWKGIASGNLGYNHYLRKEYERAVPLLQMDIGTAESFEDWGLAAGAHIPMADIRMVQNRLSEASQHLYSARKYIQWSGQKDRLRLLYPVMGKWHAAMGHKRLAADYIDSTQIAISAYNDKFNALKLLRAQQELNASELQLQENKRQKLLIQRNIIISILVLLFISVVLFTRIRNKILKQKQATQKLALQNAQSRLNDLTRKIRENNVLIENLQKKLGESGDQKLLRELKNATILTKDDWRRFKDLFKQAYPGFLSTLRSQYPDLTPAEIRLLCLRKLGLTNNEMASAQGVSPNGVIVTQYRIRKKLNPKSQEKLEDLIRGVNDTRPPGDD